MSDVVLTDSKWSILSRQYSYVAFHARGRRERREKRGVLLMWLQCQDQIISDKPEVGYYQISSLTDSFGCYGSFPSNFSACRQTFVCLPSWIWVLLSHLQWHHPLSIGEALRCFALEASVLCFMDNCLSGRLFHGCECVLMFSLYLWCLNMLISYAHIMCLSDPRHSKGYYFPVVHNWPPLVYSTSFHSSSTPLLTSRSTVYGMKGRKRLVSGGKSFLWFLSVWPSSRLCLPSTDLFSTWPQLNSRLWVMPSTS